MAELELYGHTAEGRPVHRWRLCNENGLEVQGINYGCRMTAILVPKPGGGKADILLGYSSLAGYEADTMSHGALAGRFAGRIRGAAFTLDGHEHRLTPGEGGNFLHGSFANALFNCEMAGSNSVCLSCTSPAGEDGFPGEMQVGILYTLTDKNELVMDMRAVASANTHINLTNHNYYNLAGAGRGDIRRQRLWLNSSRFAEQGADLMPTGRILPVEGGAFDFREEKPLGAGIDMHGDPQIDLVGGYDHSFMLEKNRPGALGMAAIARDEASGRSLRVYTTQPVVHLFTGNTLPGGAPLGKGGVPIQPYSGFCLETQHLADSPHHPEFPTTLLEKGDKFHELTMLLFEW